MPDKFKDGVYRVHLANGRFADITVKNRSIYDLDKPLRPNWSAEKAIRLMSMAQYFPLTK